MNMNFQELLRELNNDKFKNTLKKYNVNTKEQVQYFSFIKKLLSMKPIETVAELVIDNSKQEIEIGVLEDGCFYVLDFIPWDEVLAYTVNRNEIEKLITLEEFVYHVLYDMSFDGFEQKARDERINNIFGRIDDNDNDVKPWYIMLETLQGKNCLLIAEEIYQEEEFIEEGYDVNELLKNKQIKIWVNDKEE